jgi:hypothetical protein
MLKKFVNIIIYPSKKTQKKPKHNRLRLSAGIITYLLIGGLSFLWDFLVQWR